MMIKYDFYDEYLMNTRDEWFWWDQWLDVYCHRKTYVHNRDNKAHLEQKINWFENVYIPFLSQRNIECMRISDDNDNDVR